MSELDTTIYNDAIHKFLQIHRYLRKFAYRTRSVGISGRKVAALRHLVEDGPQTIGKLSAYFYLSDSSTSEMVADLERLGYVFRSRSKADNRVVLVEVTPEGQQLVQETPLGGISLLRERLKHLPSERLSRIDEALTDLVQLLGIENDD
jgi:DNA-binding MarR family transcriptional regulator